MLDGFQSFSLPGTASHCLLVCLEFALRTWLGSLSTWGAQVVGSRVGRQLHSRLGAQRYSWTEMWVALHSW